MAPCCCGNNPSTPILIEAVNGDGVLNIFDLIFLAQNFGTTKNDLNGESATNIFDRILVAIIFGNTTAPPSLHPEVLVMLARPTDVKAGLT